MAKYLVTGGAGFIGSNIVRGLVSLEEDVVVVDNLSTGKLDNLDSIMSSIDFVEADIRDLDALKSAFEGVDYVLHQAALRAVERSVDNPLETNDNNIAGTLTVLVAARDTGVKRVVSASSSSVYGHIDVEKQEESLPTIPASPYALSKLAGEHYCRLFSELYDLSTVSLRYFNVFGPYQNPESKYSAVIPIFVDQLQNNKPSTIHWSGDQTRDFTYIDNVVQANLKAAKSEGVESGGVYNIGNGENTSVNELYNQLQDLLGVSLEPERTDKRAGDVQKTYADISKALKDFDYEPTVSFEEGLKKSVEWYKENL